MEEIIDDNSYLFWPYVITCRYNAKKEDVKKVCWVSDYDVLIIFNDGCMYIYDTFYGNYRKIFYKTSDLSKKEFAFEFGRRLQDLLRRKNMTETEFAEKLKVAQPSLARYTQGKVTPNAYMMNKMLNVLEVKADQLLFIPILLKKYLEEETK